MREGKNIFDLTGKVALVTGGSSGLGRGFCEALAEFGADVSLSHYDAEEQGANETAEYIQNLGRRSLVFKADVSNPDAVQQMVDETVAKFGRIDILINNAGINTKPVKIAEMPVEDWDKVLSINLRGVFLCTRAVLPQMIKQQSGNIINIASIGGIKAGYDLAQILPLANYSAAKAGVISLTKETAAEYSREGIRVNCIAPGWHRGTRLSQTWQNTAWQEEQRQKYEQLIKNGTAMGRRGEISELKGLVVLLASDASSYMTGQVLISDGGFCI
jgi:NAD(P)-dependent dehydrogenase (short-subunit alcohol dehydrogenase family)